MMQLIFFAVSALVLLFSHFLVWLAVLKFFGLTTLGAKITAAVIIAVLFLSAIAASYLIHKWDNVVTRWYYMIAAFWIGILVNLFLSIILVLAIKTLGVWFGFSLDTLVYKTILIGLTFIISAYGLFNAFIPRVKDYEVKIKDLPVAWQGKTVVQISDVHLGPVYRKHFFSRAIDKINTLEPEAVFITGDLFDGMESDFSWMNTPFAKLKVPQGVYYSFGNHDLYLGFDRVKDLLKNSPVEILDNKRVLVAGLQIIGINYSFDRTFDLYKTILEQSGYTETQPSILLFHEPKRIDTASQAGIDLQLSGHTHRGQLFPFNFLAHLAYKGYGYGLSKLGDFNLIVNGGLGTWGPPMRTISQSEIVRIKLLPL
ncbi:MAG TPA: metallophosphoesterase [Candidatus Saccharimonadales bacterium]|nr:metallophosphoesterase [Candidatus Saccharimonadales bacterium]